MADIVKPYKVGDYWTNLVDTESGESVNFEEVSTWWDGTSMDDSKADGVVYRKLPTSVGGGYVKRILKDNSINAEVFGVGNGINDTTSLQTSIDICSLLKIKLIIPEVELLLTDTINIPSNTNISSKALIKTNYEETTLKYVIVISGTNITVDGIYIDGENRFHRGILIDSGKNVIINNIDISNIRGRGVYLTNTTNSKITNVYLDNIMYSDVSGESGDGGAGGIRVFTSDNIIIENGTITNVRGKGVATQDCNQVIFDNIQIENCTTEEGPSFYTGHNSKHVCFQNCKSRHSQAQAIKISRNSSFIKVLNCDFITDDLSVYGASTLFIQGGNNCLIQGNNIECNTSSRSKAGIRLESHADPQGGNCTNNLIQGNKITSLTNDTAIVYNDSTATYKAYNNTFKDNTLIASSGNCFSSNEPDGLTFTNNNLTSLSSSVTGIRISTVNTDVGLRLNSFSDNKLSGPMTYGFYVGGFNIVISDNYINPTSLGQSAIRLGVVESVIVSNNIIHNVTASRIGIEVISSLNISALHVNNNIININGGTGISYLASSGTVLSNRIYGTGVKVLSPNRTENLVVRDNDNSLTAPSRGVSYIPTPLGGQYYNPSGGTSGALVIKLPVDIISSGDLKHLTFVLHVNNRGASPTTNNRNYMLRFSSRISAVGTWISSVGAILDSSTIITPLNIRVGWEGNTPVIIVGDVTSGYQGVSFVMESIMLSGGNNQYSLYEKDYTLSLESDISNYTIDQTIVARNAIMVAAASANTASAVGATYSQAEVQAVLDELRDLKTKMRAAGLLAT